MGHAANLLLSLNELNEQHFQDFKFSKLERRFEGNEMRDEMLFRITYLVFDITALHLEPRATVTTSSLNYGFIRFSFSTFLNA